jgi:thiol-disulfide isomerase/thioredoxin
MIRSRSASALMMLAAGLALVLAPARPATAADRTSAEILADYDAAKLPEFDEKQPKNKENVRAFREAYGKVELRRSELALELFRAHPDDARVPELLLARWPRFMMDPETAARTAAEIDEALPYFKDKKQAGEARYMKAVSVIIANRKDPKAALAGVDAFIKGDPKNERGAMLLYGVSDQVEDTALRRKIFERMAAEFPDAPVTRMAKASLQLLDLVGKPLDLSFDDAITGHPVSLKGLKGKVVVLDFWATWCGPCIADMPRMKDLYAKYKDKGVEFIGVSLDGPKDEGGLDNLKAFVAEFKIAWPQYYQGNGWESEFSRKLGITSIPQLFLVDAQGNLASVEARGKLDILIPEYLSKAKNP